MKILLLLLSAAFVTAISLAAGAFYAMRAALAPLPGEWSVPVQVGPAQIDAGVPSLIRLATSSWGGPLLRGRTFVTRHGTLQLGWNEQQQVLQIRCAPCVLQPDSIGKDALQLAELHATVHRQGELLTGDAWSGKLRGEWQGEMARDRLKLRLAIPSMPLADGYALFAAQIPEVKQAQIGGSFSLQAQLTLPAGTLTVAPQIDGFEVIGLGTEAIADARGTCGRRSSRFTSDLWLARAVVAAQDRRFHDHPGYDFAEKSDTLTQQVARMFVTGNDRSAVRHLRELLYAVELEHSLGKARILRLYLDTAPWGANGLCGAEAAASHYFGVRAHDLTPGQSAWLAAMLHDPAQEAGRWAATGQINLARARWVALGLRGMTRQKKLQLADDMAAIEWRPLWVEPSSPQ